MVYIGDHVWIENYATIQAPLYDTTQIASDTAVGAYCHVGHDSLIRQGVTLAAHCSLGGFVTVGRGANFGTGVRVHQRCAIGAWAMIGAGAVVVRHIAPAVTVIGVPAQMLSVNREGLQRASYDQNTISTISEMYLSDGASPTEPRFVHELELFYADIDRWGRACGVIPEWKCGLAPRVSLGEE